MVSVERPAVSSPPMSAARGRGPPARRSVQGRRRRRRRGELRGVGEKVGVGPTVRSGRRRGRRGGAAAAGTTRAPSSARLKRRRAGAARERATAERRGPAGARSGPGLRRGRRRQRLRTRRRRRHVVLLLVDRLPVRRCHVTSASGDVERRTRVNTCRRVSATSLTRSLSKLSSERSYYSSHLI